MSEWVSLDELAARATQAVGRGVSINDILEMATAGHIRLGARIPEWESPGVGELLWIYPDGTLAGAVVTDGVARGIDPTRIALLALHGRVSLAGIRWQADDVHSDAGAITLTAGPGSPLVVADDLRILDTELSRVVAILNDEPCPPREQPAPACADRQKLRVSADERARAEIYNRWQELAGQICKLRDSERDAGLVPTEREAAARLRTRAEDALRKIEGDPAFIVAMAAMIARLEADRDLIFKGVENDHRTQALMKLDARIEAWQAHVARIKAELGGEGHQSEAAAPERAPAKAQRTVSARVQGSDGALRDALNDWTVQARAFADEIDDIDAKGGAHDGLRGIADRVAKRLRERGINGPRGPLSGGTILREALQGGRWKRKERSR